MSKQPSEKASELEQPRTKRAAVLLLGDIADTTWRMFVPTIGFTLMGWYLDGLLGVKPLLMVIGIVIGSTIASLLVYRQLQKISRMK